VRVAALYDVHGMVQALDAVLAEPEVASADTIVVGGDVAAGPFPRKALERLRALGERAVWVRGNADRELNGWAREQLSDEEAAFLRDCLGVRPWDVSSSAMPRRATTRRSLRSSAQRRIGSRRSSAWTPGSSSRGTRTCSSTGWSETSAS
jgi:hypothetical protein